MATWELVLAWLMGGVAVLVLLSPLFLEESRWGLRLRPWLTKWRKR